MVTIKDVARVAGVSPSTVSRVLAGSPRISQATRERVFAAMASLDYHPNAIARSLVHRSSRTIGLVISRPAEQAFANPFFAEAIRGIHHGYRPEPALQDYPAHLHIDLLPHAQGQGWGRRMIETFLERLRTLGVPAVHLGVGRRNTRAIHFYERVGFQRVFEGDGWIGYGMKLED